MRRWIAGALLVVACGDDGEEGHTAVGSSDTGTMESGSATLSSSDGESGSGSGSASASDSSDTSGTDTVADSGTSDATTGGPIVCFDLVCGPGQVCIEPCCGGPAPGCGPAKGDACPQGTHEVDACPFGECRGLCCEDDPCMPEIPFCADMDELMCMDDPNSMTMRCSSGNCFGQLNEGVLACECA